MEGDAGLATGIPARLSPAEGRKFGLTVGIAFLVLGGIVWWRDHLLLARIFAVLGGALVLAGLVMPTHLGPVQRAWMGLAHAISKVTTPIFMGIVFYLVMTPMGRLMRLFGRRPLEHGLKDGGFWQPVESGGKSDLERQF